MADRIEAISVCMDAIHACIAWQRLPLAADKLNALLGEMDWRSELHRLLYDHA